MGLRYVEHHEVTYYECDLMQYMTASMLVSVMIKTSESQTKSVTNPNIMRDAGIGWIITEHHLHIYALPRQNDMIYVTTEADEYNKFFCYRQFWVHDQKGQCLAHMQTVFALMDLHQRKIVPVTDEWIACYQSEKIHKIKRFDRITPIEAEAKSETYRVRFFDLDGNGHVNNAKYIDWLCDVLPFDYLTTHTPTTIDIKFDREISYGDHITSQVYQHEDETYHKIICQDATAAEASIRWECRGE